MDKPPPPRQSLAMSPKDSTDIPTLALRPHCHFPINPRERYNVDFCMPAHLPPPPSTTPANRAANRHRAGEGEPPSSPSLPQPENSRPSSPLEPPSNSHPREQSHAVASRVASPAPSVRNKERPPSTASTDYSAEFDRLSINTEFETALRQTEAQYFPQEVTQTPASPPTSSPSTESSLIPSTSGEPVSLPVGRRWVVFRGRVPGVYRSPYIFHTFTSILYH